MKKFLLFFFCMTCFIGMSQTQKEDLRFDPNGSPTVISGTKITQITNPSEKKGLKADPLQSIASFKERATVKMQPISTHPVLGKKYAKKNKSYEVGVNFGMENVEESGTIAEAKWGTTKLIDGSTITNITFVQTQSIHHLYGLQPYYDATHIALLDENFDTISHFTVKNHDTTMVVSVFPNFTTRYLNNDTKIEIALLQHGFRGDKFGQGPIACLDTVIIVQDDGTVLKKIGKCDYIDLEQVGYEKRVVTGVANYSSLTDTIQYNVYKANGFLQDTFLTKTLLHEQIEDEKHLAYQMGPIFALCNVQGENYYMTTRLKKPFIANGDQQNPIVELDNKFVIELLDAKKFDPEKSRRFEFDIFGIESQNWSMPALGDFSEYNFSTGIFDEDTLMDFVYTISRYYADCDCERTDFYAVNEKGELIQEFQKQIQGYKTLASIPGQEDQVAMYHGQGQGIAAIEMVNIPSFKTVFTFPAVHNEELLSLYFERIPKGNSYEWLFNLSNSEAIDGTSWTSFVYYNTKGEKTKHSRIDLGPTVARMSPVVQTATLDPYLFNTDDTREFLMFISEYRDLSQPNGGGLASYIGIASEATGKMIHKIYNHETFGDFAGAGLHANKAGNAYKDLYVNFTENATSSTYSTAFYKLPFSAELQGSGTEKDPYVITTAGEFDLMRKYDTCHFILGNDIDMTEYTGFLNQGFLPIPQFSGSLDGKNHTISNLNLASTKYSSCIFEDIQDAEISNITFKDVRFKSNDLPSSISVLTRRASSSVLKNIHVICSATFGDDPDFAGIANEIASSTISECSFSGNITNPQGSFSGIAGRATSNSVIKNCFTEGTVIANSEVCGIVGSLMTGAEVHDCYSSMNLDGVSTVSGISCSARGLVTRTYASGKISALARSEADRWPGGATGIALGVTPGNEMMSGGFLRSNVAMNPYILSNIDEEDPQSSRYRIYPPVLQPQYDDMWELIGYKLVDSLGADNYALNTVLLGSSEEDAVSLATDDTTCAPKRENGGSKTLAEMDQAFYESIGWKFGTNADKPWKFVDGKPHLWYEYLVRTFHFTETEKDLKVGETYQLEMEIFPATATDKNFTYISDDDAIATVDMESGLVTAKSKGSVKISAIADNGYEAYCTINVIVPVESVAIEKDYYETEVYGSIEFQTTILPANASNQNLIWTSQNSLIFKTFGPVGRGLEIGDTWVYAYAEENMSIVDSCLVSVVVPVTRVILSPTSASLAVGETLQITPKIIPTDATKKELVFSSSDENCATVNEDGIITAKNPGSCEIIGTATNGIEGKVAVTVNPTSNEELILGQIRCYTEDGNLHIVSEVNLDRIQIIDVLGRVMLSQEINANHSVISTADFATGIYTIVYILDNNNTASSKIRL